MLLLRSTTGGIVRAISIVIVIFACAQLDNNAFLSQNFQDQADGIKFISVDNQVTLSLADGVSTTGSKGPGRIIEIRKASNHAYVRIESWEVPIKASVYNAHVADQVAPISGWMPEVVPPRPMILIPIDSSGAMEFYTTNRR
ncbi:MAG: hypothetical protein HY606_09180 [Planctomycetes bacterium]|nr:hypothetical protein [Planctomycetota bacterium]